MLFTVPNVPKTPTVVVLSRIVTKVEVVESVTVKAVVGDK